MAGRTAFRKIWDAHLVADLGDDVSLLLIDRLLLHERTGGVALRALAAAGRPVRYPDHVFATMDHVVDTFPGRTDRTTMPSGRDFIEATRHGCRQADIRLFDIGSPTQGIGHVISPELGIILPGTTLVCPDSHTCSQGALGGLAWGIGSTEAEHVLATGTLRVRRPRTMRITIDGTLGNGITAKDLALHVIARTGAAGARGCAIEFAGKAVRDLDVEARLTLCNMAAEMAAFTALVAPDAKVFAYLEGRRFAPSGGDWAAALADWHDLSSDNDALFDAELHFEARDVAPTITWGTSPQHAIALGERVPDHAAIASLTTREAYDRALGYMDLRPGDDLRDLPIDGAFLGSCTNSRLSDLRRAARLLKGRHVAKGVRAICVPGSSQVKAAAEAEGIDRIFVEAGFEWRESGCSMCFYSGGESFGPRQRVVSSTNRNFESRQGPLTRTHLASPETVAASALAGRIADPRKVAPA